MQEPLRHPADAVRGASFCKPVDCPLGARSFEEPLGREPVVEEPYMPPAPRQFPLCACESLPPQQTALRAFPIGLKGWEPVKLGSLPSRVTHLKIALSRRPSLRMTRPGARRTRLREQKLLPALWHQRFLRPICGVTSSPVLGLQRSHFFVLALHSFTTPGLNGGFWVACGLCPCSSLRCIALRQAADRRMQLASSA